MKKTKAAVVTGRIIQIVELVVGIFITVLFGVPFAMSFDGKTDIGFIIVTAILTALGVFLIIMSSRRRKLITSFKQYVQILSGDPLNSIETIAEATNTPMSTVKKNLDQMIKKNYFANAVIDDATNTLVLNGQVNAHEVLQEKAAAPAATKPTVSTATSVAPREEKKVVSIKCKGCGAVNVVPSGSSVECEFCGNILVGE